MLTLLLVETSLCLVFLIIGTRCCGFLPTGDTMHVWIPAWACTLGPWFFLGWGNRWEMTKLVVLEKKQKTKKKEKRRRPKTKTLCPMFWFLLQGTSWKRVVIEMTSCERRSLFINIELLDYFVVCLGPSSLVFRCDWHAQRFFWGGSLKPRIGFLPSPPAAASGPECIGNIISSSVRKCWLILITFPHLPRAPGHFESLLMTRISAPFSSRSFWFSVRKWRISWKQNEKQHIC